MVFLSGLLSVREKHDSWACRAKLLALTVAKALATSLHGHQNYKMSESTVVMPCNYFGLYNFGDCIYRDLALHCTRQLDAARDGPRGVFGVPRAVCMAGIWMDGLWVWLGAQRQDAL